MKNNDLKVSNKTQFLGTYPTYKVDICQTGLKIIGNMFFWLCVIIAWILIVFSSVTIECPISGTSMIPTYNADVKRGQDTVYINIYNRNFTYGDIVVVDRINEHLYPEIDIDPNTPNSLPIIKRIIGLPGDKIDVIYDDNQKQYYIERNGERLQEDYLNIIDTLPTEKRNGIYATYNSFHTELKVQKPELFNSDGKLVVPDEQMFVLGDNRHVSLDSSHYGTFMFSDVEGVVQETLRAGENKFAFYWNYIFSGNWVYTIINCF